jgi:hypothetical protein
MDEQQVRRYAGPMRLFLTCLLLSGCGDDTGVTDAGMDLSVEDAAVDLSTHDLAAGPDAGLCAPGGGTHAKWFISSVTLPQSRADFSLDLNGDGKVDDQLGNIVGALMAQNVNLQTPVDQAIAGGTDVMLLDVASTDSSFTSDACAQTTFANGLDHAIPDIDGGTSFTIDSAIAKTVFTGPIATMKFSSQPEPYNQVTAQKLQIKLPMFGAGVFTLWGAHLKWRYAGNNLVAGQINGALTNDDVQNKVMPAMAAALNAQVQADPGSSNSLQLLAIFDNGGTGSCTATANNGVIEVCEVSTNAIIKNVLAPDVQLFQNGVFQPSAQNSMKDSFSIGLGFTAAEASF